MADLKTLGMRAIFSISCRYKEKIGQIIGWFPVLWLVTFILVAACLNKKLFKLLRIESHFS